MRGKAVLSRRIPVNKWKKNNKLENFKKIKNKIEKE